MLKEPAAAGRPGRLPLPVVLSTKPAGLQRAHALWQHGLPQQSLHAGFSGSHLVWQAERDTAFLFEGVKLQPYSHTLQAS